MSDRRILVPVGPQAWRWRTFSGERTLVVAARTVTSLVRVLDVLPAVVPDDPRVAVVFAYDPSSAFNDGVLDLLRSLGCRTLPWSQLAEIQPDLLLSASENIGAPAGDFPLLILPHGIGFQKFVPDSASSSTRLSGLVADELLTARRAWLAVSHPDQERQLAASHPSTVGRTVLVGDPVLDRLRASRRWRERYRSALGIAGNQRLVVLSSTWGSGSLIGTHPDLPMELLAQLPADEFRVALVLHPNVPSAHGSWQVRVLQQSAVDAGLLLVDPLDGWQQALVASDLVIGDHGSVTLYGAALGKPVLLAAFGSESVPGTAGSALREAADWLETSAPLRPRLEAALAEHRPDRLTGITDRAFAEPGMALPRLRQLVYRLLGLGEPKVPTRGAQAFPLPPQIPARVTSMLVATTVADTADGGLRVDVERFPAPVAKRGEESGDRFWHLASDVDEPDTELSESASVLLCGDVLSGTDTGTARITTLLADFPGALLAALPLEHGCLVGLRDGRVIAVDPMHGPPPDPGLAAAAVYACLRTGREPADTVVTLRCGPQQRQVRLTG
ncbi:hypothetical protein [Kitasatospora acidiphila]|uniref:hypothetical protein n=1 Tax=Kitasatospora acidiphila TaxID=2567942 RepID=UPI001E402F1E|nr:hypothetical protein [Kitasatospora acidiphila]